VHSVVNFAFENRDSAVETRMKLEGGCLCGAVRYTSSGEPHRQFVCHCRDCQRSGGSAFHIGLAVPRAGVSRHAR
jgi:hypothetical protein